MVSGHAPLGQSGPVLLRWDVGQPLDIRVAGTATCYVVPLHLPTGAMVQIEAPAAARLQVTATISPASGSSLRPSTSGAP